MTARDINFVLGKLFKAIAQNRIQPRIVANLAFVAKLMLQSLDKLKKEYPLHYKFDAWKSMERDAMPLSDPPFPAAQEVKPLPASAQEFVDELALPLENAGVR